MKRWNLEHLLSSDLPDPEDARRARMINALLVWFIAGLAIYIGVGLVAWLAQLFDAGLMFVIIGLAATAFTIGVYVVNRRGRLRLAAWMFVMALCAVVVILLLLYGHRGGVTMLIPVAVLAAALLLSRGVALAVTVGLGGFYGLIATLETGGHWNAWLLPYSRPFPADLLISGQAIGIWLAAALAWISAGSLADAIGTARANLRQARQHERQLEDMRADLEIQVAERTRALEQALIEVRQANQAQRTLLDTLRRQAFPAIPIWEQIIAMPVVGVLDAARADQLLTSLLDGIQQYDARIALLDVTGAPVIDQVAAGALIQAVNGARLIGAECILVGVNPDVAARLADLNVDLRAVASHVDMEAGVREALARLNYRLERGAKSKA